MRIDCLKLVHERHEKHEMMIVLSWMKLRWLPSSSLGTQMSEALASILPKVKSLLFPFMLNVTDYKQVLIFNLWKLELPVLRSQASAWERTNEPRTD